MRPRSDSKLHFYGDDDGAFAVVTVVVVVGGDVVVAYVVSVVVGVAVVAAVVFVVVERAVSRSRSSKQMPSRTGSDLVRNLGVRQVEGLGRGRWWANAEVGQLAAQAISDQTHPQGP